MGSSDVDAWTKGLARHAQEYEGQEVSNVYYYLTSLHWSLTQFTPASMEVVPRNLHERAFSVCVLVFALLVFPSFLGSITASMTQLRQISWKYDRNLGILKKYLQVNDINQQLSIRILKFVEYELARKKKEVKESDVLLLNMLSSSLTMSLVQEKCGPKLTKHPFFSRYAKKNPTAMKEICNKAVQLYSFSKSDIVFTEDSTSNAMWFLLSGGEFQYSQKVRDKGSQPYVSRILPEAGETSWCSEAAMWTHWTHVGLMKTNENSEALAVDAELFIQSSASFQHVFHATKVYSALFVRWLNEQPLDERRVNDVDGPHIGEMERFLNEAFGAMRSQFPGPSLRYSDSSKDARSRDTSLDLSEPGELVLQEPEQEQSTTKSSPMRVDLTGSQGGKQLRCNPARSGLESSDSSQGQPNFLHAMGWPVAGCLPKTWSSSHFQ